ncbi:MAG TPA: zf-HC2 domain-containing protein [Candidatus Polarisedimenticolaceae bacterium]|nr:zf-HC2 domain-containing protein [Candidatus Polarisedimenticolaceae bacterium]
MDHEILSADIPDLLTDRLAPDSRRRLEAHLQECEECAELVETWRKIAADLREDGARILEPHPAPAELRADGPAVARHLERCASCTLEVETWRAQQRRRLARAGFAAAALLAGVAVLLTAVRLGAPRGGPWTGPLSLVLVGDLARGGTVLPAVLLAPERPYVLLGAQFALPADLPAEESLTARITDESGRSVWETHSRTGEARRELEATGAFPLLVPADRLRPGVFSLEIGPERGGRPLLQARFEVRRAP